MADATTTTVAAAAPAPQAPAELDPKAQAKADKIAEKEAPENAALTPACKAWMRAELELFAGGHSVQTRREMNP